MPVQCKTYPLDTLDKTQSHIPRMHSKSRDIDHPRTHACTNQRPASLKQCHLSNVCANGASRKHRLMANQPRRCLIIELSAYTMRRHIAQTSCTISKSKGLASGKAHLKEWISEEKQLKDMDSVLW